MSLKRVLRSGVAAACIASVAAPAGIAAPAAEAAARPSAKGRGGLDVRVAQASDFSRIEIRGGRAVVKRDGQKIVLTLPGDPDVARLHTAPPKWIKAVDKTRTAAGVQLTVTLADNAEAKIGEADGATYVNVFKKAAPDPAQAADAVPVAVAEAEPPRPNPLPAGGVVHMDARVANGQTQLSFTWANPAGAAVFRRGDAIWLVFDAPATLDVSKAPKGVQPLRDVVAFKGADYAAIRIDAEPDAPVFVASQGATWTISLGPGPQSQPSIVRVARDSAGGPATLKAPVAGATRVINLPDPVVGDTLTVVTAL